VPSLGAARSKETICAIHIGCRLYHLLMVRVSLDILLARFSKKTCTEDSSLQALKARFPCCLWYRPSSGASRGDPASVKLIADAKDGHAFFGSRHGGGVHMQNWGERVCST
jgi:hypothetical protein